MQKRKTISELQQELQMLRESKMYDTITLMKYEREIQNQIQILLEYEIETLNNIYQEK